MSSYRGRVGDCSRHHHTRGPTDRLLRSTTPEPDKSHAGYGSLLRTGDYATNHFHHIRDGTPPMTSPQTWTARGMMQHSQRGGACRQIVGAKQKALG